MKIQEIITKHWNEISSTTEDRVICDSKTEADVLQDVIVTTIRKFGDADVDEETAMSYLLKTLKFEKFFQYKRIANEKLIYTQTLEGYSNRGTV